MLKYSLIILFTSINFLSCTPPVNQGKDCMCTMVFMSVGVTVVDQNNHEVDSLLVTVKNKLTGKVYDLGQSTNYYGNGYLVMTDNFTKDFSTTPQTITFTGIKGNAQVTADFEITTDDCKCHINKFAGPDTLRITL